MNRWGGGTFKKDSFRQFRKEPGGPLSNQISCRAKMSDCLQFGMTFPSPPPTDYTLLFAKWEWCHLNEKLMPALGDTSIRLQLLQTAGGAPFVFREDS